VGTAVVAAAAPDVIADAASSWFKGKKSK